MSIIKWIQAILVQRKGRTAAVILSVAMTVALLSTIASFIAYSGAVMSIRAVRDNPTDWQIDLVPGADIQKVQEAVGNTTKYTALEQVGYADVKGFKANTEGSVQTTGAGKVLGISDAFINKFPGQMRKLVGSNKGILVAQQTAANLHVKPGDTVSIMRTGLPSVDVKVEGVVDLPNADSLFQGIGLPANAAPQAPPDNVMLLPQQLWHSIFDNQATVRPDSVRMQFFVNISHSLPADPNAAYIYVQGLANNLEARISGSGLVGNNIGAKLSAVREDALYAKVLFLFLGLPGAVLAALLVIFITATGREHRKKEQDLLKIHGASSTEILKLQSLEGIIAGIGGSLLGIVLTIMINNFIIPKGTTTASTILIWTIISSLAVFILSVTAVLNPVLKDLKSQSTAAYKNSQRNVKPIWQKIYLDVILLALSGFEFWRTAGTGYQIVLAPEGVAAISVNYEAFIAPFCLWLGGVLLVLRIFNSFLGKGRKVLSKIIKPVAGKLSPMVSASLSRERSFVTRGILLVALAVSFAVSTSIFNTTYNMQSKVDAQLTNGSDVTVTGIVPFEKGDKRVEQLKTLQGVVGIQLMQHRFAYVGNDLQDIYGIDPTHINDATTISNAYFENNDAQKTLETLVAHHDGVLVSEETVKDFQLQQGDLINLRLQNTSDHKYHIVPFHFVGVTREFPTAPKDSFLVANASYISEMTGSSASEVVLMRTSANPEKVAAEVINTLGNMNIQVSDLNSVQQLINSSLAAVNLKGLTSIELIFAVVLLAESIGLVLALGLAERKRNFAVLKTIGGKDSYIGAFIWSEGIIIFLGGSISGALLGIGVVQILVKVLTGVFDPPPEFLAVPWLYLVLLAGTAVITSIIAIYFVKSLSRRPVVEELRSL
ncbi:FtsX-like permease family protein [Clostridium sp. WILCCON 0269]|uniref:FtsX-like permease family protein n=1 Tax=Candidatus Clostridium eludens TaxID=3381663 RepID=A0ABW8SRR8_9CLOT